MAEGPVNRDNVRDLALETIYLELVKIRGADIDDKMRDWTLKAYLATREATGVEDHSDADSLSDEEITEELRARLNPNNKGS